jgi:ABC-type protease/lipase transport system fused ATPase/permease subunit
VNLEGFSARQPRDNAVLVRLLSAVKQLVQPQGEEALLTDCPHVDLYVVVVHRFHYTVFWNLEYVFEVRISEGHY